MRIKEKVWQHRRDFTAIYECESCGATKEGSGYDDAFFHAHVIPTMVCDVCGAVGGAPTTTPDVPPGVTL